MRAFKFLFYCFRFLCYSDISFFCITLGRLVCFGTLLERLCRIWVLTFRRFFNSTYYHLFRVTMLDPYSNIV